MRMISWATESKIAITEGRAPLTDGGAGIRVLEVLEAATTSLAEGGRQVELTHAGAAASTHSDDTQKVSS